MQRLTNETITEIEHTIGVSLPGLYRKLLIEIGHGKFDQKPECRWNTAKEIYHPTAIRELYSSFFDNPSVLFSPYFPFGCDNQRQDLWIIDSSRELAACIAHSTHPDDWPEEEWLAFEDWIKKHLKA
ncbi:MAG TPA: SMI1/KNR4 family protein [Verrucomicrobiae bacterium]